MTSTSPSPGSCSRPRWCFWAISRPISPMPRSIRGSVTDEALALCDEREARCLERRAAADPGASFAAPAIATLLGGDLDAVDLYHRLAPPSFAHPLGTDEIGRDLLLRLLEGGRVSLLVGMTAAIAAAAFGTAIGLVAGYRGGRLDATLMRLTDGMIALPLLPLLVRS